MRSRTTTPGFTARWTGPAFLALITLLTAALSQPLACGADTASSADRQVSAMAGQIRSVLARAKTLAARFESEAGPQLPPLLVRLGELEQSLLHVANSAEATPDQLGAIHNEASSLARQIAFCNPKLNFDKLLFLKRHDAVGVYHMCDQFYGCNAKPGGGLFVLVNPFSSEPEVDNLLENSVVENGRLKGQKLEGGTFLSPEVSFDGQTILFAYSEAKAWDKYQGKEAYEWNPEISFHIFKCNADGTGLVQLTDGDWDDFDPCFLPNGRIAFISERRGGYLRCGRHCPVYTMHSMNPDGSDMIC